jgi:cytochrome c553
MRVVLFLLPLFLFADAKFDRGEKLYFGKSCLSCHGVSGKGLSGYPSLAGQSRWDLDRKLKNFRAGKKQTHKSSLMIPFAKNLTNREIRDLAYFLEKIDEVEKDVEYYYTDDGNWGDGGS